MSLLGFIDGVSMTESVANLTMECLDNGSTINDLSGDECRGLSIGSL